MRILSWVRSKISKTQNRRFNEDRSCCGFYTSKQNACKEEFKDWTQTFLAIGTFGNDKQRELDAAAQMPQTFECPVLAKEAADLSIEEVIKLQMEIAKLLKLKPSSFSDGSEGGFHVKDLPDNHKFVRKRSVSLLVKKMFAHLQPSLRKPVTEPKMEKIFRKILHKKIHPQAAHRVPTTKMYLQKNPEEEEDQREEEEEEEEEEEVEEEEEEEEVEEEEEEEEEEEREDGSKWVRTDAEYIVLEI